MTDPTTTPPDATPKSPRISLGNISNAALQFGTCHRAAAATCRGARRGRRRRRPLAREGAAQVSCRTPPYGRRARHRGAAAAMRGRPRPTSAMPFIQPIKGIKSIQLDFSHAVGAAEFGLFESGAPPPASARWAVVGSGLGPIDKVRSCPQASNSCPFCPIQCLAHHRQHVHRVASQTLLARASRTRLLIVHVRRGRHARCARRHHRFEREGWCLSERVMDRRGGS